MPADSLPDGHRSRPATPDDAEAVTAVIAACQVADRGVAEISADAVRDDWHGLDLAADAVVVVDAGGRVVACADILNRRYVAVSVYGYARPESWGRGIGRWLVGWGEAWARERMQHAPPEARVTVQHYIDAVNQGARRLLGEMGYAPVRGVYTMAIALDAPPPPARWPDRVRVRVFVPGEDERRCYETVEDAFRDVWGRPRNTFERFLGETTKASFDPGLWFLAEAEGDVVGVALCGVVGGQGQISVVGVLRPWRERGVGLALLHHAFGAFWRRDVREIGLSVDAESITGAPRLYERAGMYVNRAFVIHQMELRAGVDLSVQ